MNSEFDHEIWRSWQKGQIEEAGNSPDGWIRVSRNLVESAALVTAVYLEATRIILRNVLNGGPSADTRTPEEGRVVTRGLQIHSVGLMLFGFSIECLLKASYLRRGGKLYVGGKLRHPKRLVQSHNLAELAHVLECSDLFTDGQLDVLDLLSARNEMGRYPVHARYDSYGLQPAMVDADGLTRFYGMWDAHRSAKVFGVLDVLYSNLDEEVPDAGRCLLEEIRIQCAAYRTPLPAEFVVELNRGQVGVF